MGIVLFSPNTLISSCESIAGKVVSILVKTLVEQEQIHSMLAIKTNSDNLFMAIIPNNRYVHSLNSHIKRQVLDTLSCGFNRNLE